VCVGGMLLCIMYVNNDNIENITLNRSYYPFTPFGSLISVRIL